MQLTTVYENTVGNKDFFILTKYNIILSFGAFFMEGPTMSPSSTYLSPVAQLVACLPFITIDFWEKLKVVGLMIISVLF